MLSGLPMLALLEKRASGDTTDPPQGYDGANATDQARLRTAAAYILDRVNETAFYAYRDGNLMFALAEYALTGGPDKSVLGAGECGLRDHQAGDGPAGRSHAGQPAAGARLPERHRPGVLVLHRRGLRRTRPRRSSRWPVSPAAKAFYSSGNADSRSPMPRGSTAIDAALTLARRPTNSTAGPGRTTRPASSLTATERGHGYNASRISGRIRPSLQQTASGIYIQLFGGANVNSPACSSTSSGCATVTAGRTSTTWATSGRPLPGSTTCGVRSRAWS